MTARFYFQGRQPGVDLEAVALREVLLENKISSSFDHLSLHATPKKEREMRAKFPSECPFCGLTIRKNAEIARDHAGEWAHKACSQESNRRVKVTSGETFRSRRKSDWRRR